MNTINLPITLYTLDELTEQARTFAIEEHREFLLSIMTPSDFISGDPEFDTPEELQKAYESEYNYTLENDDTVVESIETNEYQFYSDGAIAHILYKFPDGTASSRETWLKQNGQEFRIA